MREQQQHYLRQLGLEAAEQVEPGWQARAACKGADPDLFYAERGTNTMAVAKAICRACPVREACLSYALAANEHHGLWGGYSPRERRALRRRRRRAA